MKRSKKYAAAAAKIDQKNLYTPSQAVKLAKETSTCLLYTSDAADE